MNAFTKGMNEANRAFAKVCTETFEIITGGLVGTATADSIDDLTTMQAMSPGGVNNKANVIIFMSRAEFERCELRDGAKLEVYGVRVRVNAIEQGGEEDDQMVLTCGTAGVSF